LPRPDWALAKSCDVLLSKRSADVLIQGGGQSPEIFSTQNGRQTGSIGHIDVVPHEIHMRKLLPMTATTFSNELQLLTAGSLLGILQRMSGISRMKE